MYVWGGGPINGPYSADLRRLDLETRVWHAIDAAGKAPSARAVHSACACPLPAGRSGGSMFVFGGYDGKRHLNDAYLLEISVDGRPTWRQLTLTGDVPSARRGCAAAWCAAAGKVVLFGGSAGGDQEAFQDMYMVDPSSGASSSVSFTGFATEAGDTTPVGRFRHSLVEHDDLLWVFGGATRSGLAPSDLHSFDHAKREWKLMDEIYGDTPPPIECHSCAVIGRKMFVFGGTTYAGATNDLRYVDFERKRWLFVPIRGSSPAPRYLSSAVAFGDALVVFGGVAGLQIYNDVWAFC